MSELERVQPHPHRCPIHALARPGARRGYGVAVYQPGDSGGRSGGPGWAQWRRQGLLQCLAGLTVPTRGMPACWAAPLNSKRFVRERLGYCPDGPICLSG